MYLSDGFAVMPEQSTVAIIAHHPQAVYFGMKSGRVPEDKKPDELIAGTERGGELPPDEDAAEGRRGRGRGRRCGRASPAERLFPGRTEVRHRGRRVRAALAHS